MNFTKFVDSIADAFQTNDDGPVEDVRKTLMQVRQRYDQAHALADQQEEKIRHLREDIRTSDLTHGQKGLPASLAECWQTLETQYRDTTKLIKETQTSRKVYGHMLARIQKEQAIVKQKMLNMEAHLGRKRFEVHRKKNVAERSKNDRVQGERTLDSYCHEVDAEREACQIAKEIMEGELEKRKDGNRRRADFESWRREVSLAAANEAFNASAGKLRKVYAIEKLAGNCLQKITFEQVERSQNTEDGFQKIRDVTGLADVMDIVHKFLNRDVEHEQLKSSVKDAEDRLEALRKEVNAVKQTTEGMTFDGTGRAGALYKDMEQIERVHTAALEEHEAVRLKLQRAMLQMEHVRRWAGRVGQLLSIYEEPVKGDSLADLPVCFQRLEAAVPKFCHSVALQIKEGKIDRKVIHNLVSREFNDQARMLANQDFLRANCRVPPTADAFTRSTSHSRGDNNEEDDPNRTLPEDRDRIKAESGQLVSRSQIEQAKRRPKG